MDCTPPPFPDSFCYPLKKYPSIKVNKFGSLPINNIEAIKKEIYANGPVSCSIMATKKFEEEYHGGIFS
jgi:hypothetical protein